MKGKIKTTIALLIAAHMFVSCNSNRPFHAVKVDNPAFFPDTAFVSFEDLASPKFKLLKEKYQLDTIFHGEKDELKRILLLRHWMKQHIKIDNNGVYPGDGSAESILDEALKGHGFHCGHDMVVQNAIMNAYGYVARCLGAGEGTPDFLEGHHGINEIWLNGYDKWFMSDSKYDYHFEKNHIPLSALEIRDEYLKNKAEDITLVKGPGRIPTDNYPELNNRSKELFAKIYTWISWEKYSNKYVDWPTMDSSDIILYQDDFYTTHTWIRDGKPHWAYHTPYLHPVANRHAIEWTPNTISSQVEITGATATVKLTSITPGLKTYQLKENTEQGWKNVGGQAVLDLNNDRNEFAFRAINLAGVTGPEHNILITR